MTWKLFGDLVMMFMILGGAGLFIWANVTYNPNDDDDTGVQRSLAAHLLWEQRVAGSNPATPTTLIGVNNEIF